MSLKISRMNHPRSMSLLLQNLLTTREQLSSHLLSSCYHSLFVTLTVCRQHDARSSHLKPHIQFQNLVVVSIGSDVCSSASLRSYVSEIPECVSGLVQVLRYPTLQEFLFLRKEDIWHDPSGGKRLSIRNCSIRIICRHVIYYFRRNIYITNLYFLKFYIKLLLNEISILVRMKITEWKLIQVAEFPYLILVSIIPP